MNTNDHKHLFLMVPWLLRNTQTFVLDLALLNQVRRICLGGEVEQKHADWRRYEVVVVEYWEN